MPLSERTPEVTPERVIPEVSSLIKETPVKNVVSEIGKRVDVPVSWDSACRV